MRCFRSTSPTVFTLFTLFLIKNASGTPILQDEQNLNLRIERAQPGTERGEPVVLVERLLSYHSKESESAPAAQTTGAHGYGYGINPDDGIGKSEADGIGIEICLLHEGICLGEAAALALGGPDGKADGYGGALNGDETKGSVAQAGVDGLGIAGADALNLCLGEACFGLAGAFAYGDASASAQGGDLTSFTKPVVPTATSLSILTPVTSNSDSTEKSTVTSILATPTPSFTSTMTATISVASRVPHGLLAAALAEVTKMVQIKQLHLREEAAPTPAN